MCLLMCRLEECHVPTPEPMRNGCICQGYPCHVTCITVVPDILVCARCLLKILQISRYVPSLTNISEPSGWFIFGNCFSDTTTHCDCIFGTCPHLDHTWSHHAARCGSRCLMRHEHSRPIYPHYYTGWSRWVLVHEISSPPYHHRCRGVIQSRAPIVN